MKEKLYQIIFEAETPSGKLFDVLLILAILISIVVSLLDSVQAFSFKYSLLFFYIELFITILFAFEYILRIYCSRNTKAYIFSFFGIIDFISILPFIISMLIPGSAGLATIRGLRVLRVFRILKLTQYSQAGRILSTSIKNGWPKISVFLLCIVSIVFIVGSLMYLVEGRENGFTSIPRAIYWAIVTMTTVGYGDLVPKTDLGQFISSILMIMGYGVIAVPTGIISSEIISSNLPISTRTCPECYKEGHLREAKHCYECGANLSLD